MRRYSSPHFEARKCTHNHVQDNHYVGRLLRSRKYDLEMSMNVQSKQFFRKSMHDHTSEQKKEKNSRGLKQTR